MSLFSIESLTFGHADRVLLKNIDIRLLPGEHAALDYVWQQYPGMPRRGMHGALARCGLGQPSPGSWPYSKISWFPP